MERSQGRDIAARLRRHSGRLAILRIAERQLDRAALDAEAFRQEPGQSLAQRLQRLGLGDDAELACIHGVPKARRLVAAGRLVEGELRPEGSPDAAGAGRSTDFCDAGVLRTLRRRSLAALRAENTG